MTDEAGPRTEAEAGMALAGALEAAHYGGDGGEDVDRLIAELEKRGYRLQSDADDDAILRAVDEARRDREAEATIPDSRLRAALERRDWVIRLVSSYLDRYGLTNTSGERHADRKMRVEDIRAEIAALSPEGRQEPDR